MTDIENVPRWVYLALIGSVLSYAGIVLYALVSGDPIAELTADVLFGLIALAVGAGLYWVAESRTDPLRAAGASFVTGGLAQFLAIMAEDPLIDLLATLAVLSGVGLYVYATRYAN
ncbi:hypothetical protein [Natranaeroarchaeum sulfidigenes]|uniref:Putative membrane protein n=1 Tax=Natranaeroarchaeum sulfidigenes TaxID=2784880 RepID=A0A897MTI1_9EURY|nr:hypothetical protein [Natranaeroarchaeum sulfidigenes]QSG03812.1 putative membrane protein [Natranaeroarchaeum sulfidigenes]